MVGRHGWECGIGVRPTLRFAIGSRTQTDRRKKDRCGAAESIGRLGRVRFVVEAIMDKREEDGKVLLRGLVAVSSPDAARIACSMLSD